MHGETANLHVHQPSIRPVVPHQLPADVLPFSGTRGQAWQRLASASTTNA